MTAAVALTILVSFPASLPNLVLELLTINLDLGDKDVDEKSSTWDDHDEDCHGTYEACIDDPDYQSGFIWDCCDKKGDSSGCKTEKHNPTITEEKKTRIAY
jgi:hypothetical protein